MSTINKYHNGRIYKIVSHKTNDVYIGSTYTSLKERLRKHRVDYTRYLNGNDHYITSFELLKYDDHDIILLEYCKCETKEELHARERYYIESMVCVNKIHPGRTHKEYYEDNKEDIAKYKKEYYEDNKKDISDKMKQWREENKDYLIEYEKRRPNKMERTGKLLLYNAERINCKFCNLELRRDSLSKHIKAKHIITNVCVNIDP